jgi:hypothetical protein
MKFLGILIIALSLVTIQGCGTVASVWEGGKTVVTGTIDAVVQGTTQIVSAVAEDVADTTAFVVDTTAGVVEDVAAEIDEQTDELQDEESEGK